jgi:ribosomal protein L37AE/L43A
MERLKRLASMSREDAIKAMMDEKTNVPKRWCDTCHHEMTYTVNGIGMWICDLCRRDNTPNNDSTTPIA